MRAQKLSLPWGASPHVFAQPSKQQSPLLGQSVSLCPGDQQVDTAPCIQLINICPGDQQVDTAPCIQLINICPGDQQVETAPCIRLTNICFGHVWLIQNIFGN